MGEVKPLKGVLKLKTVIKAKTGLHIGGSKENVEIGGIDNIVEKLKVFIPDWDPELKLQDTPYIPGSSLKGKLRSLLEWFNNIPHTVYNKSLEEFKKENEDKEKYKSNPKKLEEDAHEYALQNAGMPCKCGDGECDICRLFGAHQGESKEPIRLRFADFYPTECTVKELWGKYLDESFVEVKVENMIDRIKGVAKHPRHTERVIAGSEFEGYITLRIFEGDDLNEILKVLKTGFEMLEDDYLGGSGSRGYGRVEIRIEGYEYKKIEDGKYEKVEADKSVEEAINKQLGAFLQRREASLKC